MIQRFQLQTKRFPVRVRLVLLTALCALVACAQPAGTGNGVDSEVPLRAPAPPTGLGGGAQTGATGELGARATLRHQAMGTEFVFILYAPSPDMFPEDVRNLAAPALDAIDALEQRISTWIPDSETSRVNARAAEEPVKVGPELLRLLLRAKRLHRETQGAFDVTVGPLLELWGFYTQQGHFPSKEELDSALKRVGMAHVQVDETSETVRFTRPEMRLDFGGIAKGLALDRALQILRNQGFTHGALHAGTSTVVALNPPPGGDGWTVRIRNPYNTVEENDYLDEVRISEESVSTSSSAERFVELDGKKYSHIFDPRTGQPVRGVLSATAIAPSGLESDALSTAFFVLGIEGTKAYCKAHPAVRAILVVSDGGTPKPVRINFPGEKERT